MPACTLPQRSAYALVMDFEQTLSEVVDSVIEAGLAEAGADSDARRLADLAWRDRLTALAATELSDRYTRPGRHRGGCGRAALRRWLMPYSSLVTATARALMACRSAVSMAAD